MAAFDIELSTIDSRIVATVTNCGGCVKNSVGSGGKFLPHDCYTSSNPPANTSGMTEVSDYYYCLVVDNKNESNTVINPLEFKTPLQPLAQGNKWDIIVYEVQSRSTKNIKKTSVPVIDGGGTG